MLKRLTKSPPSIVERSRPPGKIDALRAELAVEHDFLRLVELRSESALRPKSPLWALPTSWLTKSASCCGSRQAARIDREVAAARERRRDGETRTRDLQASRLELELSMNNCRALGASRDHAPSPPWAT
jgi:hypothetical protein